MPKKVSETTTKKTSVPRKPRAIKVKIEKRAPAAAPQPAAAAVAVAEAVNPVKSYIAAVGRRKEASARVRLIPQGSGTIIVNGREMNHYFSIFQLSEMITAPLKLTGEFGKVDIVIKVAGGGMNGQAEASRHGIARALVKLNEQLKPTLKKAGFLTRDPRVKERKKFGLKKARRAPQWAKR